MNDAKCLGVSTIDFVYVKPTEEEMADPNAEYWTVADIAEHWGVKVATVRAYRSRKRGELPHPDHIYGRTPLWRPATIISFDRPGQGARTDLKNSEES